jgi:flagellar biosynthesis/type III secretory pathway protein FliH
LPQTGPATKKDPSGYAPGHIEVFQYPAGPDSRPLTVWEGWGEQSESAGDAGQAGHEQVRSAAETALRGEFDKRMAEEARKAFETGRERGRQEGRQAEHEAQSAALAAAAEQRTHQAAAMIEGFAQERDRFLHSVEREVVELALAVAARILRREAQMDPLLLTGAVRVALGQLSGSTTVKLRVPAGELELWTEAMAVLPNLALKPAVVAGEGMRLGDCVVETELGSVDLGIRSQLGEIERGFFDRAVRLNSQPVLAVGETAGAGRETRA